MPSKEVRQRILASAIVRLKEEGLTDYTAKNNGYALIFREPQMLPVDYYPSTGTWRVDKTTMNGDVNEFIKWYLVEQGKQIVARAVVVTDEVGAAFDALRAAMRAMHNAVEDLAQIITTEQTERESTDGA